MTMKKLMLQPGSLSPSIPDLEEDSTHAADCQCWHCWGNLCGAMACSRTSYESEDDVVLQSSVPSPEEEAERSLRMGGLTDDARYVVDLIVNTPIEAIQHLHTPLRTHTSRTRLARYLGRIVGWEGHKIQRVFRQLEAFVGELP